ncbi:MAG: hypothetical protein ABI809_00615 [Caldimonas sp.]
MRFRFRRRVIDPFPHLWRIRAPNPRRSAEWLGDAAHRRRETPRISARTLLLRIVVGCALIYACYLISTPACRANASAVDCLQPAPADSLPEFP